MLRRAWRAAAAVRGGTASISFAPPSSSPAAAACAKPWLAPWSVASLSSRTPDDDKARRRASRRASRRDLNEWRGADVTLRELRELRPTTGPAANHAASGSESSKRRWARDWANAVFADDVGDGVSYEAFVAEALRHGGDAGRGPGSGPGTRRSDAERKHAREKHGKESHGAGGAGDAGDAGDGHARRAKPGAPKGGGKAKVKYKRRRGEGGENNSFFSDGETRRRRRADFADGRRSADSFFFDERTSSEKEGFVFHDAARTRAWNDGDEDDLGFWEAFRRAAAMRGGVGGFWFAREGSSEEAHQEPRSSRSNAGASSTWNSFYSTSTSTSTSTSVCPDRATLGIDAGVSLDAKALKSSLRRSALRWHPDRHAAAAAKARAEIEFKKCYDAYDALLARMKTTRC